LADNKVRTSFYVLDVPAYLNFHADGILGWSAMSNNIVSMDFVGHKFEFLAEVPEATRGWEAFPIRTDSGLLDFEIPGHKILAVDSGTIYGVELNPQSWLKWKSAAADPPLSIEAYYTPNSGLVISEEGWADRISVGGLVLTEV